MINFKAIENQSITIRELRELNEIVKTMKCSLVYIFNDGTIYGTDDGCIHLKTVFTSIKTSLNMIVLSKDLAETVKYFADSDGDDLIYTIDHIQNRFEYMPHFTKLIHNIYYEYKDLPVSHVEINLKANGNFNEINAMRASDGVGLLKLSERYILAIFPGMLPVNKADKLELYISDIDEYRYLAKFTIVKKSHTITAYYMYLVLTK